MPVRRYIIPDNRTDSPEIKKIKEEINSQLRLLNENLRQIQGIDDATFEMLGVFEHKGTKFGFFSETPVVQQSHIAHAETSHGSATTTELDALGVVINNIISLLETYGLIKTS